MNLVLSSVIAHRGSPKEAPENTLASFKKAVEQGAKWVECDVLLTKDDEPVIFHDFELSRTTNGGGKTRDTLLRDIEKLDAGSWFSADFSGEKVPTLQQMLAFAHEHSIGLNLELKCNCGREKLLAETVREQTKELSLPLLISSFNYDVLKAFREYSPNAYLGYNCDGWSLSHISRAKKMDCFSIHIPYQAITPTVMEECTSNFLTVLAYTVNDKAKAETLLNQGVTSVFSDTLIGEF